MQINEKKAEKLLIDLNGYLFCEWDSIFDSIHKAVSTVDEYEKYADLYTNGLKHIKDGDTVGMKIGKVIDNIIYTQKFRGERCDH